MQSTRAIPIGPCRPQDFRQSLFDMVGHRIVNVPGDDTLAPRNNKFIFLNILKICSDKSLSQARITIVYFQQSAALL